MKLKYIWFFACMLFVTACAEKEMNVVPELEINRNGVFLKAIEGEASFEITTNTPWKITSDADWLSFDPSEGEPSDSPIKISVTAENNNESETRVAVITIVAGTLEKQIKASQDIKPKEDSGQEPGTGEEPGQGEEPELETVVTVNPVSLEFEYTASQKQFEITSNKSWTVSTSVDWITVSPSAGVASEAATTVTVSVSESSSGETRNGSVSIEVDGLTREVTVSQSGKPVDSMGSGTETDPYLLKTPQDMVDMRTLAKTNATTYFKMENDIDMTNVTTWTPVNNDEDFTRQIHFDGNSKTITNFAPQTFTGSYPSIFGVLYGSCKNVTITNVNIDVDAGTVGVLGGYVGTTGKEATVTNVHISGIVKATGDNVGGFGGATRGCTLSGCTSEVNVTGKVNVGGFIGVAQNVTSTFEKCHYNGESTSTGNALGGICGGTNSGAEFIFRQCWVEGTLSSTGRGTAGIVGNSLYARIENCYSTAAVSNDNQSVGGLVGVAEGNLVVTKSYCSGSATGRRAVGGIVGYTSKADDKTVSITDCIAWNPSVTASRTNPTYSSGAVVGYAAATCTLKGCYYKSDMTFKDNSYTLSDTEDVESGQPQSPITDYYSPYHGKSSNGKTLSELAGALGWDSAIWDLTTMTLK